MLLKYILWAVFVEQLYGQVDFGGLFDPNFQSKPTTVASLPQIESTTVDFLSVFGFDEDIRQSTTVTPSRQTESTTLSKKLVRQSTTMAPPIQIESTTQKHYLQIDPNPAPNNGSYQVLQTFCS
jgi:hypothetical protein